jgi:hypothetical protein
VTKKKRNAAFKPALQLAWRVQGHADLSLKWKKT